MTTPEGIFAPKVEPYKVAPETYVIPQLLEAPPIGMFYVNSMVITGSEPVLVDTGAPSNRQQWLAHAWSLVDPADVRWVFLTHDDHDHAGNVREVMAACPNATLVTTWFSMARYAVDTEEFWMPFNRSRWVRDGESFSAGDRTLVAVRPPFFDNPTTRGLFDPTTRVYWAADTFATALPHPVEDAADLDREAWRDGMLLGNRLNHPWHLWLDTGKFNKHVDRVQNLDIDTAASCHGPAIHHDLIDEAFELIRRVPELPYWEEPGQDFLEDIVASTAKPVVP
jgi:flavorubredoxin